MDRMNYYHFSSLLIHYTNFSVLIPLDHNFLVLTTFCQHGNNSATISIQQQTSKLRTVVRFKLTNLVLLKQQLSRQSSCFTHKSRITKTTTLPTELSELCWKLTQEQCRVLNSSPQFAGEAITRFFISIKLISIFRLKSRKKLRHCLSIC